MLVRKAKNKFRMCVEFTDLNTTYLKDLYSMSDIDLLVDGSLGYRTLSFMNAYLGYN